MSGERKGEGGAKKVALLGITNQTKKRMNPTNATNKKKKKPKNLPQLTSKSCVQSMGEEPTLGTVSQRGRKNSKKSHAVKNQSPEGHPQNPTDRQLLKEERQKALEKSGEKAAGKKMYNGEKISRRWGKGSVTRTKTKPNHQKTTQKGPIKFNPPLKNKRISKKQKKRK